MKRPCSVCGTMRIANAKSRPDLVCHACRRKRNPPREPCVVCGEAFIAARPTQSVCSRSCGQRLRQQKIAATVTDEEREARRVAELERWRAKNRARRGPHIISEPYTLAEIAERDGYRCGLCRRKVNMALRHPHPRSPTIDHIEPLSISNDDTRRNVQLAHRRCNVAKNVRAVGEQLALIG